MTLEHSPEDNSDTSMYSPAVSRARTLAKQGSEPDYLAIARACGLNSPALLAKFDPVLWLPRMLQASLLCPEQWEPLSGSWPDSVMWDQASVYELQISAQPTLEKEFSLWPTARQEEGESCGDHPHATDSLTGGTRSWPTPQCHDAQSGRNSEQIAAARERSGAGISNLNEVATLWPTPRTITGGAESTERKQELGRTESGGGDLQSASQLWQTPATDSFRSRGGTRKEEKGLDQQAKQLRDFVEHSLQAQQTPDGPTSSEKGPTSRQRLNPQFVEWLMGFPPGWTEL